MTIIHNLLLRPSQMTEAERLAGRFMRAPDHGAFDDDERGLDNGDDDGDDTDQSGDDTDLGDDAEGERREDGSDPSEDDEDAPSNREGRNGYERRIARLTRRLREAEERLRERTGDGDREERREQPRRRDPNAEPQLADYDTYEEYVKDLARYEARNLTREERQREENARSEREFRKRMSEGKKAFSDWDSVVTEDVEITTHMARAIREEDNPAAVIYYLGENPDEADEIAELPPLKQALRIAKIAAKLDTGKSKDTREAKRTSSAPDPIRPVRSNKAGVVEKDYDKMTPAEFMRVRNAELRGKR